MQLGGVSFRLNTRIVDAHPGVVLLSDGEIHAETLVWTAGTAPSPFLKSLPLEKDKRGALLVDGTLAVPGHPGLWGIGDFAPFTAPAPDHRCPPPPPFASRL